MSRWVLWNERDDRPASIESFPSRELAERTLHGYRDRDARGGRPDLHDVMPHVVARCLSGD